LELLNEFFSAADASGEFLIEIFDTLVFVFKFLELSVLLIDFLLQLFAVVLSLSPTLSLDIDLLLTFGVVLGKTTTFVLEVSDPELFFITLRVKIFDLVKLVDAIGFFLRNELLEVL
jgi:Na+-transporting NADH:ubiquinone oxidoreductase subunit NqrD